MPSFAQPDADEITKLRAAVRALAERLSVRISVIVESAGNEHDSFVIDRRVGGMFKVEMLYAAGWADAEWTEDDRPLRFMTVAAAQQAIDELIATTVQGAKDGDLSEPYRASDYRVVRAGDERLGAQKG